MVSIFTDIRLQPAYGFEQVLVNWTLAEGFKSSKIYIYRSADGVEYSDSWELLNENNPVQYLDFFVDDNFKDKTSSRNYFYRLVALNNNTYYDSPVIGMFNEGLNKKEYGVLRYMRKQEYLRMRARNGVRILHCIPAVNGEYAEGTDSILKARVAPPCKEGDKEDPEMQQGVGLYKKEFSAIVQTWAELVSIGELGAVPREDAPGNRIAQQYAFRMLGFPTPNIGDMIVLPHTDKRFSITNNIRPFLFKGYLPVAYDVVAEEIDRNESRYKIPMPQLLDDPQYPTNL
jgi:hypothetical protein